MEKVAVVDMAVKICGLTRLEDALLAAELGAWALGFVLAPSPRRLTPAAARALVEKVRKRLGRPAEPAPGDGAAEGARTFPLLVGVFGDTRAGEIAGVVHMVGFDAVQLHGSGGPGTPGAAAVREALGSPRGTGPLIIQAVPVTAAESDPAKVADAVARVCCEADLVLLDAKAAGRFGGSGTSFRWPAAKEAAAGRPLLVAGGIRPDNVRAAFRESGAWGVDVSSGVEVSPGVKDPTALRRLFANVGERDRHWAWPGARAGT